MIETRPDLVCFLPTLAGGGAERVVLDLASTLVDEKELDVVLVVASKQGPLVDSVPSNVPLVDLGHDRRTLGAILPLARFLRRTRPRAILSTLEHANLATILASFSLGGTRVVIREANTTSRDIDTSNFRGRMLLRGMRLLYPRASGIVAVSHGVAHDLKEHIGVPPSKISVISNPVLTERVWKGAEEPTDHPWFDDPSTPVILGVGRLAPQKGFEVLIRAFAAVRARTPARLLILGEGEQREPLQELATELGVAEDFQMPGYTPNPFPYLSKAKVFALSSYWEGLPNVLIQAVALGTNVVATDCRSGPSEILDGGDIGRLVPVGDAGALAEGILSALRTPDPTPTAEWLQRYDTSSVASAYHRVLFSED